MAQNAQQALVMLLVGATVVFSAAPGLAQSAGPHQLSSGSALANMQARGTSIINNSEVFVAVGSRKTRAAAIRFAREYYRDFRSVAVTLLANGRWATLVGWVPRREANQLMQRLRFAGRIPNGSFTVSGGQIDTISWAAASPISRAKLRIPANIRQTSILRGMGIAGTWGASVAACRSGVRKDDLLESPLRLNGRQFEWGSFGRCQLGSMVRVSRGLFMDVKCPTGVNRGNFVISLRRRGAKLEVITDPTSRSKIYYQLRWCSAAGGVVSREPTRRGPRVARVPNRRNATPSPRPGWRRGARPSRRARSTGSGFFVTPAGHFVTNEHVVRKCDEVFVKGFGQAQIIQKDAYNDLALLKLNAPKALPYVKVRSKPVQLGQEIVVFGYPLASILNNGLNVTTGIVSSETGMRNDKRMIQFSAAIQPGNSGGPIVDRSGNLVAVVKSKFSDRFALDRKNFVPQTLNFGVKVEVLSRFLSRNGVQSKKAPAADKPRSVADLAATAKSHTMLVSCH